MFDLKRLRTRESIPLGLRHDSGTHLKRSDWWRLKVLVPVFAILVSPDISIARVCMCSRLCPRSPDVYLPSVSSYCQVVV